MRISRVIIIVVDSLGIGALPDAAAFGDDGAHTLDNISLALGARPRLANLAELGLGLIDGVTTVARVERPIGSYGRMMELTRAKDTISGHLEMAGVVLEPPFATFANGIPQALLARFTEATGYGWLGGCAASGTEIIKMLGPEHQRTGKPIVYTSADSVFQIAAHTDVIALDELYRICEKTRAMLDPYMVGRVIARPFTGSPGAFKRTADRRDFSMDIGGHTLLEALTDAGVPITSIGKIGDIYSHRWTGREIHAKGNEDVLRELLAETKGPERRGLIMANLVDFDMLYGHRRDARGYATALEAFDKWLPGLFGALGKDDMLIITADHGCDPTHQGTDHTREYVPLLVYSSALRAGVNLGTRGSLADVGATLAEIFGQGATGPGRSFMGHLL